MPRGPAVHSGCREGTRRQGACAPKYGCRTVSPGWGVTPTDTHWVRRGGETPHPGSCSAVTDHYENGLTGRHCRALPRCPAQILCLDGVQIEFRYLASAHVPLIVLIALSLCDLDIFWMGRSKSCSLTLGPVRQVRRRGRRGCGAAASGCSWAGNHVARWARGAGRAASATCGAWRARHAGQSRRVAQRSHRRRVGRGPAGER